MTDLELQKSIISSAALPALNGGEDHDDAEVLVDATACELRQAVVPLESHGQRLDLALAQLVPEFSRSYLQQLIKSAGVVHNGLTQTKASGKVKAGDSLSIELKPDRKSVV